MTDQNPNPALSEWNALAEAAKKAREDAAERARSRISKTIEEREEENQTALTYKQKFEAGLRRDQSIVQKVSTERIQRARWDWKQRVGSTFANAASDHPIVLDRVSRLSSGGGLHKTSLIFTGPMGVGKSWQAYSFINMAIDSGALTAAQVVAGTESGILSRISSSGYKRPEMMDSLLDVRHKVWFIDDVGTGHFSQQTGRHEVWYQLVDHAYRHHLTLLLTTNLSVDRPHTGLEAHIGARAFDRLKSLSGADGFIVVSGVNKRLRLAEEREAEYIDSLGITPAAADVYDKQAEGYFFAGNEFHN